MVPRDGREDLRLENPSLRRLRLALAASTCLVAASIPSAARGGEAGGDPLRDGFRDPPRSFSQVPFWSWNGRLEPERIRWQIDQMVEKGVYGAFLHARAGLNLDATPYFSEGWWRAVEAAVEHGAKVGFAAWLYDEDQWPSGAAGGRTIRANPERNTRKGLRKIERMVEGPAEVPLRIEGALYVVAGRLRGDGDLEPETLVEITDHNDPSPRIDPEPTRGLRVGVVSNWGEPRLAARCRALGCAVTELRTQQAATLDLRALDVLVSDVGTPGTTVPREHLLSWIRAGGGYIDFSHSEPGDGLYDLAPNVEDDAPDHHWLLPEHPIASAPNPDPDSSYGGRRWSDMSWRGGADYEGFERVLADPRSEPPPTTILARKEGRGRVVFCGATQACREGEAHLELLQNLLVWASGRDSAPRGSKDARASAKRPWACPEGTWLLSAYILDTNPGTEAMPAVNYMHRDTVRDFIDITYEEYARRFGAHFGKTIPGVFFDEIHNSGVEIVWVEGFAEAFRELKGYDLIPLLPALSRDIGPGTPKVRCDYYDVYTKLYEEAWFVQISGIPSRTWKPTRRRGATSARSGTSRFPGPTTRTSATGIRAGSTLSNRSSSRASRTSTAGRAPPPRPWAERAGASRSRARATASTCSPPTGSISSSRTCSTTRKTVRRTSTTGRTAGFSRIRSGSTTRRSPTTAGG